MHYFRNIISVLPNKSNIHFFGYKSEVNYNHTSALICPGSRTLEFSFYNKDVKNSYINIGTPAKKFRLLVFRERPSIQLFLINMIRTSTIFVEKERKYTFSSL